MSSITASELEVMWLDGPDSHRKVSVSPDLGDGIPGATLLFIYKKAIEADAGVDLMRRPARQVAPPCRRAHERRRRPEGPPDHPRLRADPSGEL